MVKFSEGGCRIATLNTRIAVGELSCVEIVAAALVRAAGPEGEGSRAFRGVRAEAAMREAQTQDGLRASGVAASPLAGLPVSIKDNIDFAGSRRAAAASCWRTRRPRASTPPS